MIVSKAQLTDMYSQLGGTSRPGSTLKLSFDYLYEDPNKQYKKGLTARPATAGEFKSAEPSQAWATYSYDNKSKKLISIELTVECFLPR